MFNFYNKIISKFSNRWLWIIIILVFLIIIFFYYNFIHLEQQKLDRENEELIFNSWALQKDVELNRVQEEEQTLNEQENQNIQDRITRLRENLDYYLVFNFWENIFYFRENENSLDLLLNWEKITSFDIYEKNLIDIKKIYSSNNYFFKVWNTNYIYDFSNNIFTPFELFIDIEYIKKYNNKYIFVTSNGSYIFDIITKDLDFFNFFHDFVYYKSWYIWIVSKDDEIRKSNLWLDNLEKNSIFKYNPNSKEKTNLFETDLDLTKIYYSWVEIYFEDSSWKKYILENFD